MIDSALDGYSATIFAYGQTGSGKTFTMAGKDEKIADEKWSGDEHDGIIPRSVEYMWNQMTQRTEKYFVKASFLEIYNEQLMDLLNPGSGILHHRWNVQNGFFVQDQMFVECTRKDDLIAVLHEGVKNRKTGSHLLNSDSSRSHSILTVYLISEVSTGDNHSMKKYGKISFVDLAGSERLKESKSEGDQAKETGNINKSLFTLGKVISCLSDKKTVNNKHIPYRDSKLTMLLMDSLGGASKALMIATVSPSETYMEETLSTLNYATRTMNIKNKPIIQMDAREQVRFNLKREIQLLKLQNNFLKQELGKLVGNGFDIPPVEDLEVLFNVASIKPDNNYDVFPPIEGSKNRNMAAARSFDGGPFGSGGGMGGGGDGPFGGGPGDAMQNSLFNPSASKFGGPGAILGGGQGQVSTKDWNMMTEDQQRDYLGGGMLTEMEQTLSKIKHENSQLRYQKEVMDREHEQVMFKNGTLHQKLANLENVFIGDQADVMAA